MFVPFNLSNVINLFLLIKYFLVIKLRHLSCPQGTHNLEGEKKDNGTKNYDVKQNKENVKRTGG